jgi:oligopeptide/dipeptide ABC transporter ATP-binding protein
MSKTSQNPESIERADPILDVDSISVEFSVGESTIHALRDVSLIVSQGETVGIAGESGSGKSTLALAILRYLDDNGRISSGTIDYKHESLLEMSSSELQSIRGNEIAHVPQNPKKSLNPSLTVGEQIREAVSLHQDLDKNGAWERVYEVLDQVNIPDPQFTATQYPHQLSGGMQQRVLFAIALSCDPELLVLDEPTTGLDVTTEAKILDLIQELKATYNVSILIISHDLGVLAEITDRITILYAGEIMERGPVEKVFYNSANPYTRALLDTIPEIDHEKQIDPIPGNIPDLDELPEGCIFAGRCSFATDECSSTEIGMATVDTDTNHKSRCLHWDQVQNEDTETTVDSPAPVSESGDPVIEVENVTKHYGRNTLLSNIFDDNPVRAVDGVSLTINEGETVAVVGESGCGKSTFGRVLLRLLDPTSGTICFRGNEIGAFDEATMHEFRKECQAVFQNPDSSLNPRKSVAAILDRPLQLFTEKGRDQRQKRRREILEQVGLSGGYSEKYPHELSGGEKQRVAIARAFITNPSFVLLDEPVSALDVSVQAGILNLLDELKEEYGTSYLMISHDLSVVKTIADRVAVMYLGKFVERGPTAELFNPPYHPYTRALLSSTPSVSTDDSQARIHLDGTVPSARDPPSGCSFRTRCPQEFSEKCTREEPQLNSVGEGDGHCIACHLDVEKMIPELGEEI